MRALGQIEAAGSQTTFEKPCNKDGSGVVKKQGTLTTSVVVPSDELQTYMELPPIAYAAQIATAGFVSAILMLAFIALG